VASRSAAWSAPTNAKSRGACAGWQPAVPGEQGTAGQTLYDTDFSLDKSATPLAACAHRPHGPGLPAESLDSWVLFYKSLFDLPPTTKWCCPTLWPGQEPRALRSQCGTLRLPLNISENRNTAIAHALSSYRGSGASHRLRL
jgi:4-hydroxyphenylpyruvate dioxygenase